MKRDEYKIQRDRDNEVEDLRNPITNKELENAQGNMRKTVQSHVLVLGSIILITLKPFLICFLKLFHSIHHPFVY